MELTRSRIKRVIRFSHSKEDKQLIICSAIRQMRPIEFDYHSGFRVVEPFALGIVLTDHRDNLSLLCFQVGGVSDLNEAIGWRLYRVSDMEDIEVLKDHFTGDRPGYEPQNLEMAKLICYVEPAPQAEESVTLPVREEVKIEASPIVTITPSAPPPPVVRIIPAPEAKPRPIVRVINHNQLMERFRYAHPPTPELNAMVWPEPLKTPFPERPDEVGLQPAPNPSSESPQSRIWPDNPVTGLIGQTV